MLGVYFDGDIFVVAKDAGYLLFENYENASFEGGKFLVGVGKGSAGLLPAVSLVFGVPEYGGVMNNVYGYFDLMVNAAVLNFVKANGIGNESVEWKKQFGNEEEMHFLSVVFEGMNLSDEVKVFLGGALKLVYGLNKDLEFVVYLQNERFLNGRKGVSGVFADLVSRNREYFLRDFLFID